MKDSYNLLEAGTVKLLRALAAVERSTVRKRAQGSERYFGFSIKEESPITWSGRKACTALLGEIVAGADSVLEVARQAPGFCWRAGLRNRGLWRRS